MSNTNNTFTVVAQAMNDNGNFRRKFTVMSSTEDHAEAVRYAAVLNADEEYQNAQVIDNRGGFAITLFEEAHGALLR